MALRIGISSCLVGEAVRWDGRDKRQAWLDALRDGGAELVPICPEVEIGLGVPRPPMRLVVGTGVDADELRLRVFITEVDHTDAMRAFAVRTLAALRTAGVDGYVLKSRSPSCGLSVAVESDGMAPGLFAAAILGALNDQIPIIEETELDDPERFDAFIAAGLAAGERRMRTTR